jgi:hypothetical protein
VDEKMGGVMAGIRIAVTVLVFFLATFSVVPFAHTSDVYIAQNAAGGNTGTSCTNAHSAAWFNSNATGGNTYHLCGTFTGTAGTTMLTPPNSGSAGNPLIIRFEQGAVLQAPYWGTNGAIYINGLSYITIDGDYTGSTACGYVGKGAGGSEVSCNGVIQNTANGTPAAGTGGNPCTDGWPGYTYQQASSAIIVGGTNSNIEIKNLRIKQMYMNDGSASCATDTTGSTVTAIQFRGTPTSDSVHNCEISDGVYLISADVGGGSNLAIYNNYIHSGNWHIGFGSSAAFTGVQIHDNEITDWTNWGWPSGTYHQDGIFVNPVQTSPGPTAVVDIYGNYLHGNLVGGSPTAFVACTYAPGSTTGVGAQCRIFNNVIRMDVNSGGYISLGGNYSTNQMLGQNMVLNNTLIGNGGYYGDSLWDGESIIVENNVFYQVGLPAFIADTAPLSIILSVSDYNDYYISNSWASNGGSPPAVNSYPGQWYSLSQWQALGYDTHSLTTNPSLSSSFMPNHGSPLDNAGANLTSLNINALNFDAAGKARPAQGAWTIGAYNYGLLPPKNLRIDQ